MSNARQLPRTLLRDEAVLSGWRASTKRSLANCSQQVPFGRSQVRSYGECVGRNDIMTEERACDQQFRSLQRCMQNFRV